MMQRETGPAPSCVVQSRVWDGKRAGLTTRKSERKSGDVPIRRGERSRQGHRTPFGRPAQTREPLGIFVDDQIERIERRLKVGLFQPLQFQKKRPPLVSLIKPTFPMRVELLLHRFRKLPEGDALRRIENLTTAKTCDREDGSRLRKIVGAWESPAYSSRSQPAKLPACIPPLGKIHLAHPGDDQPQLRQTIKVDPGSS